MCIRFNNNAPNFTKNQTPNVATLFRIKDTQQKGNKAKQAKFPLCRHRCRSFAG